MQEYIYIYIFKNGNILMNIDESGVQVKLNVGDLVTIKRSTIVR